MICYYVLDIESTGLSVDYHEINQISVLRVSDGEQYTTRVKVKNPRSYNAQALQIQGITPDDLKKGISIEETIEAINMFLNEDGKSKAHRCIVAHNAAFDRKFVHRAWDNADQEFPADLWMCTQSFAKRYIKKNANGDKIAKAQMNAGVDIKTDKRTGKLRPKFGLNNFMEGVGLTVKDGAHSAEVDVQNTVVLYEWLMNSGTEHVSLISRIPHKETKTEDLDIGDVGVMDW